MWLQQLEHGWVTWEDNEGKLRFRWVLVWHPAMTTTSMAAMAAPLLQKKQLRDIPGKMF